MASPETVRLRDYTPAAFGIDSTELEFDLGAQGVLVKSKLQLSRNRASAEPADSLRLDGVDLELRAIALNGRALDETQYSLDGEGLSVHRVPERFTLETEVWIEPQNNTSLEGLYQSSGNFCTQCEAESFRKITYYLDRPDVMSRFTTTIVADASRWPVMLSNGNPVAEGECEDGRRWIRWEDPFRKPSYLFALVAGNLSCVEDSFRTASGRDVALRIYVEPHNADKCGHAMASLKKSMRWDEEVYGLEYDLELFMIVAVDDFNMGAMENKGLNVFNSKYVLAKPETATDTDFTNIEAVIAHEYFHNWTGNRVTCRDWFQLSLKEGLTVFRDQEFSADMASRAVKRIQDVRVLRSHQFPEDAGPMAHPVRPDSYIEISNFYTVTVYNKGAEVIRMIHTLLGQEGFRQGMDLYFERHDGKAVTTEEFVSAMEDATEVDLRQFRNWYSQAGTPAVKAAGKYDAASETYELTLSQTCAATPGQPDKSPFHIPVRMSLLTADGQPMALRQAGAHDGSTGPGTETVLSLTAPTQTFQFESIPAMPTASLGRGFSAPVRFETARDDAALAFAMANDDDEFNRWDAAQEYGFNVLLALIQSDADSDQLPFDAVPAAFTRAFERTLTDARLEPALIAETLRLPSESNLADRLDGVDPDRVHLASQGLRARLARSLREPLAERYLSLRSNSPYRFDATATGERSLKNLCLGYLMELDEPQIQGWCRAQLDDADNMTDALGALACFANDSSDAGQAALLAFRARWHKDPLVLDKWFSLQATSRLPGTLAQVRRLMDDPGFDFKNPNRVRSLVGAFCHANPVRFHDVSGQGYAFLREQVLALDTANPQVAARLLGTVARWRRFEPVRRSAMRQELERILITPGLSRDIYEIASKTLG